jgi:hypothetical protein
VETIHSTSTNSGLTNSNPPYQIFASNGSQRIYWLFDRGGAVLRTAYCRSEEEISSPWILVQWRLGISSWLASGSRSQLDKVNFVGRIERGGGRSQGAGWARQASSSPSPHPMSTTCEEFVNHLPRTKIRLLTDVISSRLSMLSTHILRCKYSGGKNVTFRGSNSEVILNRSQISINQSIPLKIELRRDGVFN